MRKPLFPALPTMQEMVGASQRWLRWLVTPLPSLVILLIVSGSGSSPIYLLAAEINPAHSNGPGFRPIYKARPPQVDQDLLYDHFLQEFTPLRKSSERRQYIARQILTAAAEHRVDPDLLFSLVAVESGFNSAAISPKGARGLGQVMLTTAQAIAPNVIHQANDLYDIRRNLYVTALEVRRLLDKWGGDVWSALSEYSYGSADQRRVQHSQGPYVARICMYYALLKMKKRYHNVLASNEGDPETLAG